MRNQSRMENTQLIDSTVLDMLRCPVDHSSLEIASEKIIAKLNKKIAAGEITNAGGDKLEKQIDGGLIRAAGDLLYPVIDRIPVMLAVEAIDLSQIGEGN